MPNPTKIKYVGSIENASILRKFTIFFLLMSLIPTVVLYYFYLEFTSDSGVRITESSFNTALIFIVIGVLISFFQMRKLLQEIVDVIEKNKQNLEHILSPEEMKGFDGEKNEIAVLTRSFNEINNRLDHNVRDLQLAKKTLYSIMTKVGAGISNLQNIDTFLELILETVCNALQAEVGVLMFYEKKSNELAIKSVYGISYDGSDDVGIKVDKGTPIDTVIQSKQPIVLPKLSAEMATKARHSRLFKVPLICAPLVYKDKIKGIVTVSGGKDREKFDADELDLVNGLASQIAVAIENLRLSRDNEKTYFETIAALALAIDAKDRYSRGHVERVARYCVQIATRLGLDEGDIQTLRNGARVHDIGKIGIPDEILLKPGPLTPQEWDLMRKHTEIGESIIKPISSLRNLCDIVRHHHEKLDGSGYPDGLKGDEISPLVRIIAIADIYDALTTSRPYRKTLNQKNAFKELKNMGEAIDQEIVDVFIESFEADGL